VGCNNDSCELDMAYPERRELDGCYFRVERDGKWQNICFSDLTENERYAVTADKNALWLQSLCNHLANSLHNIGDELDLCRVDDEE